MTTSKPTWADAINSPFPPESSNGSNEQNTRPMLENLCTAFSSFPFMAHNELVMVLADDSKQIQCITEMSHKLIGNVRYNMLHGGVTATMLDSVGGIQVMADILLREIDQSNDISLALKKITKVATLDLRVDYLLPGKGEQFIATAEIIRLGYKSATVHMQLVNELDKKIAIATASYVY